MTQQSQLSIRLSFGAGSNARETLVTECNLGLYPAPNSRLQGSERLCAR